LAPLPPARIAHDQAAAFPGGVPLAVEVADTPAGTVRLYDARTPGAVWIGEEAISRLGDFEEFEKT
jgi:hypothetical protein